MSRRFARLLTWLYPKAWRTRYGNEFMAFLEAGSGSAMAAIDVLIGAIREHLRSSGGRSLNHAQSGLVLMMYAWLTAVAGGVNLWWTVDDNPLMATMQSHAGLLACWMAIEVDFVVGFVSVIAGGLPGLLAMIRFGHLAKRHDVLLRLAFPAGAAVLLLIWMIATFAWSGGHWVPLPSALVGTDAASAHWPPLPIRWTLCSVTLCLMIAALVSSAVSIRQAIARTATMQPVRFSRAISVCLAFACILMAGGVLGGGIFAERRTAALFYAHSGGVLNTTTSVSWLISLVLFTIAAIIAGRAAWGTKPVLALR